MTLQMLLDDISAGTLLPAEMFSREDLDDILDQRDASRFEQSWLECSERIRVSWEAETPSAGDAELVAQLCKESFLVVSRATQQHEIASYVSDDFELIGKSITLGMDDPYATVLLDSYRRREIPR